MGGTMMIHLAKNASQTSAPFHKSSDFNGWTPSASADKSQVIQKTSIGDAA